MGRGTSGAGGKAGGGKPFQVITDAITFTDDSTLDSQVNKVAHNVKWKNGLNPDELSAVKSYTGSGYYDLNDALRSKNGVQQGTYLDNMDKNYWIPGTQ